MRTLASRPEWLDYPQTHTMMRLLGAPVCFFGGAVRDGLLGRPVQDIDLMVELPRQAIIERLEANGFAIIAQPGDVKAVLAAIDGVEYDMLPLSAASAPPCDLTINALQLSPQGAIADPYGGMDDLRAGRVRFAGNARARVAENHAHILRFFRFHARYAEGEPDPEALEACIAAADHIRNMAPRFIDLNLFYLLLAPRPSATLEIMQRHGLFRPLFGFDIPGCGRLAALETVESLSGNAPDSHTRFIALLLGAPLPVAEALEQVRQLCGLADDSYRWKCDLLAALPQATAGMTPETRRALLQKFGPYLLKQAVLLAWATQPDPAAMRADYQALLET